jgi:hypothetical protein
MTNIEKVSTVAKLQKHRWLLTKLNLCFPRAQVERFWSASKKLHLPNSFSYDVLNLYQTQIEPLESALVDLEIDLDNLKDTAETIDSSLDSLIEEARIVNETLITVTPERLNSKLLRV